MKKIIEVAVFSLFLLLGQYAYAQTNSEIAKGKAREAVELMDAGKTDESIKLLEEAQKLDPDQFVYPYEIAYAHYLKGDYKGSISILEKIINYKDVSERLYQLLGNSYDILGQSEKAFEVYDAGLKKFPHSGCLYLEKGNVYWDKKDYEKALPFYEKGIEVDPGFPSNYYRATLLYCASSEKVWGMIYGEIFMNLERNSKRTAEISKLLFDTYKKGITFASDSKTFVSFSKNASIKVDDLKDPHSVKMPFGVGVYEPTLLLSLINEKSIDLNSLDRIRTNFIDLYYKQGNDNKYPNVLFDYQRKVQNAGYFESYNHWLLMKGDEDAFDQWYKLNKDKWEAFVKWFSSTGLKLDDSNKFNSGQY